MQGRILNYKIPLILIIYILTSCINDKNFNTKEELNSTKNNKYQIIKIDSNTNLIRYYDKNGSLSEEGKFINDSIKIGKWSTYENNQLTIQREFIYVNNSVTPFVKNQDYINQFWLIDENGEVAGGSFYEIDEIKDEYDLGESIPITIFTPWAYFNELDSELYFIYSTKEEFDNGITNRDEINYDTIWNVAKRYPDSFDTIDKADKFHIIFVIKPEKAGDFKLSGIVIEEAKDFSEKDSLYRYREMFLEISFKVNDTIDF
ncbi:hypothetical protein G3567_13175 [Psychroflexus sp. YR1-1]|uniref:Lipoprotein n=1 Tax=Psychroflexus aurantiacus TaxID=2709310 RepID=A0A6B3R7M0_9FLAO|nr:hypothetical protein [Psychroflexus aurantiacus]NEV95087.1 hypothetical protein [Psychroflexus aurantiacus]